MKPARPRRLTILDALALIGATAVGLAPLRTYAPELFRAGATPWGISTLWSGRVAGLVLSTAFVLLPPGVALSAAVLVLALRGPRRRIGQRPGVVACAVAVATAGLGFAVASAVLFLHIGLGSRARAWPSPNDLVEATPDFLTILAPAVGAAVLGAWMATALGRRWRAERSWPDRLGRVLGGFWIFAGALWASFYVERLFN